MKAISLDLLMEKKRHGGGKSPTTQPRGAKLPLSPACILLCSPGALPHSQGHRTACLPSSCRGNSAPKTAGLGPFAHLQPGLARLSQRHETQRETLPFVGWGQWMPHWATRHKLHPVSSSGRSEPSKRIPSGGQSGNINMWNGNGWGWNHECRITATATSRDTKPVPGLLEAFCGQHIRDPRGLKPTGAFWSPEL